MYDTDDTDDTDDDTIDADSDYDQIDDEAYDFGICFSTGNLSVYNVLQYIRGCPKEDVCYPDPLRGLKMPTFSH